MKYYRIFSADIAGKLCNDGFKYDGTETNKKFPQFKVFLFEDTAELREALTKIKNQKTKENEQ